MFRLDVAGQMNPMRVRERRDAADGTEKIRVAEYVRMSTDHQQYSTENQRDAIQRFAEARGMQIVRSFVDAGKSGVGIQGRDALQDLIRTVESGQADFTTILVYDVSRWGRFQQPDEGAYYEFRCFRANIKVEYCAEQFPTDNAPMSAVMKSLKRAMAGEYSRELSSKVFAGQCRLITLGFRQGGTPGYGLRRQLLDQHGQPKAILARGERKSFQLERVVLVPGPEPEIQIVRRIYRLFIEDQLTESEIATILNGEGIPAEAGGTWSRGTVHQILTNEKYIGNNLYNRTSAKLQRPRTINEESEWVRCNRAYQPVVDVETFARAQQIINQRDCSYTDEQLLDRLRELLTERGLLSGLVINAATNMPSAATYAHRFNGLRRAYELIGYSPERDYSFIEINRALRVFHQAQVAGITEQLRATGATVDRLPGVDLLRVNHELTIAISVARCCERREADLRWVIRLDTSLNPDITIAARMAAGNSAILDYFIFPSIDRLSERIRLAPNNGMALDVYRFPDLDVLAHLVRPRTLREVA